MTERTKRLCFIANRFLINLFQFSDGKICLDVLHLPPGGSYNPAITLESILLSVQLLLASPNPDDPLRGDVSDEYKYNRDLFNEKAKRLSKDRGNQTEEKSNAARSNETVDDDKEDVDVPEPKEPQKTSENVEKSNGGESSAVVAIANKPRKRKHDET